ncbi:MAG: hypothetical protein H0U17_01945 [Actinobacteria bacterium]|nr:hypothetical protein [Actinomycetota bacterium]
MTDLEALQAAYRATWSLFIAIEAGDNDVIEAICAEYDEVALLKGWSVVAKRLRMALHEHGEHLGCHCGSEQWLEAERLYIADGGD